MDWLVKIICLSLFAAFVILLITKIGLREWVQTFAPKLLSKLFSCDFCLSFWICVLISFVFYIFVKDENILVLPFLASPLTRLMI